MARRRCSGSCKYCGLVYNGAIGGIWVLKVNMSRSPVYRGLYTGTRYTGGVATGVLHVGVVSAGDCVQVSCILVEVFGWLYMPGMVPAGAMSAGGCVPV